MLIKSESQTGHGQQRPTTELQCGSDQSEELNTCCPEALETDLAEKRFNHEEQAVSKCDWGRGQQERSVLPEKPSSRSQRVRISWSGWLLKHRDV